MCAGGWHQRSLSPISSQRATVFLCPLVRNVIPRCHPHVACVCSDTPSGTVSTTETHAAQYCRVTGGALRDFNDVAAAYICEIDLTCPSGWTLYTDSGTEGRDSCLFVSGTAQSSWAAAATACPAKSHLLTIAGSSKTSGLAATAFAMSTTTNKWAGCSQSSTAASRGSGWSWMDGTPSTNLNCNSAGAAGCNLWTAGEPK